MTSSKEAVGEHLSIGEVLAALHDEFPDITISKIRFLESQGLIDPERTPSGYRKFYADDVTRLRWILFQQKENFLPLKVIKDRLAQLSPTELATLDREPSDGDGDLADGVEEAAATGAEDDAPDEDAARASGTTSRPSPPRDDAPARGGQSARPQPASRRRPAANRPPAFAPTLPLDDDADAPGFEAASAATDLATRDDVCAAAGITAAQLSSLEEYGVVAPAREAGDDVRFDADAIEAATIAAGFFARGLEARHLRMYRTFAEREAGLFAQVLLPYMRQRNPDSRARLQSELVELATLGRRLRTVQLRDAVRDSLSE
jgi:DNA-binding transcriptional MerR regulator